MMAAEIGPKMDRAESASESAIGTLLLNLFLQHDLESRIAAMIEATMSRSTRAGKKWMIVFHTDPQKTVHFGADEYQDYTMHRDRRRRRNYISRHRNDPTEYDTPGELSRIILWSATTLAAGIRNYEQKHSVRITMK